MLRVTALAEIRIYRDVSQAVMPNVGHILGWSGPKAAILAAGIQTVYLYERLGGWRRMVTLQPPARRNALGGPPRASSEFTRLRRATGHGQFRQFARARGSALSPCRLHMFS